MDFENIIKKILKNDQISEKELNTFITEYIKLQKNKDITHEKLIVINQLIKRGIFDLMFAAKAASIKLNIQTTYLIDKNGFIIKVTFP